ncbi:MAG: CopG family transcriptional regulator [Candidatus Latescibacterota bacterium]
MVRTQIQLTEAQARWARRLAAERHVSVAEIIRQALDGALRSWASLPSPQERIRRAMDAAGRFRSGSADGSARHDEHLAEAYRK